MLFTILVILILTACKVQASNYKHACFIHLLVNISVDFRGDLLVLALVLGFRIDIHSILSSMYNVISGIEMEKVCSGRKFIWDRIHVQL